MRFDKLNLGLLILITSLLIINNFIPVAFSVTDIVEDPSNGLFSDQIGSSSSLPIGFTNHAPIRIENNSGFNASNGVTGGVGSANNPYIIDGWEIDGSGGGFCIYIGNTTDHFIVRNCSLHSADGRPNTYYWNAGISIYNNTNGSVINNTCFNNNIYGIYLQSATNISVINNTCKNNTYGIWLNSSASNNKILENSCSDNTLYGIVINSGSNNIIHHNNLINNNGSSIQALDNGSINIWDDSIGRGNYWDDYESRYKPPAVNDGYVWNISYELSGSAGAKDNYPLAHTVEFDAPEITDLSASAGTTGQSFDIICNITDESNVTAVYAFYWFTDNIANAQNVTMIYNAGTDDWRFTIPLIPINSPGPLYYNISAVDTNSNWDSKLFNATITDNVAPVAEAGPDFDIEQGTLVFFNASSSSDNVNITFYRWQFFYRGFPITRFGRERSYYFTYQGDYLVTLYVEDADGNNDTDTLWVNVTDNNLPQIYNPDYPTSVVLDERIDIKINGSDPYIFNGIPTMKLNFTDVDGTMYNETMPQAFYTQWRLVLPARERPGIFKFYFWANDTAGNWNKTEVFTIEVIDHILPKILSVNYPMNSEVGHDISIQTEVNDNIAITDVKLNYTDTNGIIQNVSMTNTIGNNYTQTITGQSKTGVIKFHVWVVDYGNNSVLSNEYEIPIIKKHISIKQPRISWLELPSKVEVNNVVKIIVNVTDESGVDKVFLNYSDVFGKINNVSMFSLGDGNYSFNIPSQSKIGLMSLYATAININGIWNRTDLELINVMEISDKTPPKILTTTPKNNSEGIKPDVVISIFFDESMNILNVETALKITPEVGYNLMWLDNNVLLKITFSDDLNYDKEYKLIINTMATDVAGNRLANPEILIFTIMKEPGTENDADKDGMDDDWEILNNLNPDDSNDKNNDSDGDGLTNLEEFNYDTNPQLKDTDYDNMTDDWEVLYDLDPRVNDADKDDDNDGFTNIEEYKAGTIPNDNTSHPPKEKGKPDNYVTILIAILIVVIIIIILLSLLIKRSRERAVPKTKDGTAKGELEDEQQEVECPECGAMIGSGETECKECGAEVETEEESETEEEADQMSEISPDIPNETPDDFIPPEDSEEPEMKPPEDPEKSTDTKKTTKKNKKHKTSKKTKKRK
jgi:parallel beta-helix repeat protein